MYDDKGKWVKPKSRHTHYISKEYEGKPSSGYPSIMPIPRSVEQSDGLYWVGAIDYLSWWNSQLDEATIKGWFDQLKDTVTSAEERQRQNERPAAVNNVYVWFDEHQASASAKVAFVMISECAEYWSPQIYLSALRMLMNSSFEKIHIISCSTSQEASLFTKMAIKCISEGSTIPKDPNRAWADNVKTAIENVQYNRELVTRWFFKQFYGIDNFSLDGQQVNGKEITFIDESIAQAKGKAFWSNQGKVVIDTMEEHAASADIQTLITAETAEYVSTKLKQIPKGRDSQGFVRSYIESTSQQYVTKKVDYMTNMWGYMVEIAGQAEAVEIYPRAMPTSMQKIIAQTQESLQLTPFPSRQIMQYAEDHLSVHGIRVLKSRFLKMDAEITVAQEQLRHRQAEAEFASQLVRDRLVQQWGFLKSIMRVSIADKDPEFMNNVAELVAFLDQTLSQKYSVYLSSQDDGATSETPHREVGRAVSPALPEFSAEHTENLFSGKHHFFPVVHPPSESQLVKTTLLPRIPYYNAGWFATAQLSASGEPVPCSENDDTPSPLDVQPRDYVLNPYRANLVVS